MGFLAAIPIIGKVIESVISLVDKAVLDKDEAARIKAELTRLAYTQEHDEFMKIVEEQASIIRSEAQGEGAAQRNWRPHLMYLIMGLLVFNGALVPLVNVLFSVQLPVLEAWKAIPQDMWSLLQIGMGGYIVGRTVEKGIDKWKGNENK